MTSETKPLRRASNFIRLLRTQSADMQMQQADVLIAIALEPGITMSELINRTNLSQSSVSRNVQALSTYQKLGQPGLGLVDQVMDPRDPRRRLLFLTSEGKTFITKLMRTIDPSFSIDNDTDARVEVERLHEEAAKPAPKGPVRGKINPR